MQKIIIPIAPRTKKNSQQIIMVKGRPMIIPSRAYRQYEKDCGVFLTHVEPFLSPCNVKCLFFMPTRRRVDLNNLLNCITDVLVKHGILMDDNSNIIKSFDGSRVYYDKENPRTEIIISEYEEEECENGEKN